MRTTGSRRDRETDHLLAGPLAPLARAAAVPAHSEELSGEDAATAAFVNAEPGRRRSLVRKVLTVKAMLVLAAACSTGVVLAATGGALPTPWTDNPPPATKNVPPPPSQAEIPVKTPDATPTPRPTSSSSDPSTATTSDTPGSVDRREGGRPEKSTNDRDGEHEGARGHNAGPDKDKHPKPPSDDVPVIEETLPTELPRSPQPPAPVDPLGAVPAVPPSGAEPSLPGG